jgi:tellurite resistance protein
MNKREEQGVISICILAALADGSQSEAERELVQKTAEAFRQKPTLAAAYQEALARQLTLSQAAQELQNLESRVLAYQTAVCVCIADGSVTEAEKRFLRELRAELHLESDRTVAQLDQLARTTPTLPPKTTNRAEQDMEAILMMMAVL